MVWITSCTYASRVRLVQLYIQYFSLFLFCFECISCCLQSITRLINKYRNHERVWITSCIHSTIVSRIRGLNIMNSTFEQIDISFYVHYKCVSGVRLAPFYTSVDYVLHTIYVRVSCQVFGGYELLYLCETIQCIQQHTHKRLHGFL